MKVILIAHDQLELTKQGIEVLQMFSDIENEDIIIVDNASDDHLSEWLSEQNLFSYLICDEGIGSYATIINSAVREFEIQENYHLCHKLDIPVTPPTHEESFFANHLYYILP